MKRYTLINLTKSLKYDVDTRLDLIKIIETQRVTSSFQNQYLIFDNQENKTIDSTFITPMIETLNTVLNTNFLDVLRQYKSLINRLTVQLESDKLQIKLAAAICMDKNHTMSFPLDCLLETSHEGSTPGWPTLTIKLPSSFRNTYLSNEMYSLLTIYPSIKSCVLAPHSKISYDFLTPDENKFISDISTQIHKLFAIRKTNKLNLFHLEVIMNSFIMNKCNLDDSQVKSIFLNWDKE